MIKLEIKALQYGKRLILEAEEDIRVSELIRKIGTVIDDDGSYVLISCDKEGVLPSDVTLADISAASGELLLYVRRSG